MHDHCGIVVYQYHQLHPQNVLFALVELANVNAESVGLHVVLLGVVHQLVLYVIVYVLATQLFQLTVYHGLQLHFAYNVVFAVIAHQLYALVKELFVYHHSKTLFALAGCGYAVADIVAEYQ
ncbi:hypothetical protein IJU97_01940 [bacterium]|nr:hypothetical protein [bacterium]